jgi:hypothetical protein
MAPALTKAHLIPALEVEHRPRFPGHRHVQHSANNAPDFYAAYLRNPDGNKLAAYVAALGARQ